MLQKHRGGWILQRLFSTFPGGWPGLGLLLLRLVVGSTAFASGAGYMATLGTSFLVVRLVGILEIVLGVSLVVGFLTPVASMFSALIGACFAFGVLPRTSSPFFARMGMIDAVVVALALTVLGAGAFSLDAYLFGRREIIIPEVPHSSKH